VKKYLLVNMSPRPKGTSARLLNMCADSLEKLGHFVERVNLYPALKNPDALYASVGGADGIVLSGPCYINTYPADVTAFLEGLAAHPEALHGQSLYGIIQGGMPYAHTHESGLNMLQLFARKCGLNYLGGFVMGMGAMLDGGSVDKLFNAKKVKRQLNAFFEHVGRNEASPRKLYLDAQLRLPAFAARFLAMFANKAIDAQRQKLAACENRSASQ
jgi:multimeric flavodoxin WrbA